MSSSTSDSEKLQAGQDEEEVDVMEFRLFASQDTPTAIVLAQTQPELVYVHRERPDLEESPESERMNRIADAAIDSATIMEQARILWVRGHVGLREFLAADMFICFLFVNNIFSCQCHESAYRHGHSLRTR